MSYLPPYSTYRLGQPVPKVTTSAQVTDLRKTVDFTQYVWPNVTKDWQAGVSINRDSDVNSCVFVWMYDTDYGHFGYQGAWSSLAEYITAALSAGTIISGPQIPTSSQVETLRNCADFQVVADYIVKANSYRDPATGEIKYGVDRNDISKIMSIWSTTPAFKREYKTIANYLSKKCSSSSSGSGSGAGSGGSGGGSGGSSSSFSLDTILNWLKADSMNPIIAALGGFAVYMTLFRKR